jgi:hypothetical protein
MEQLVTRAVQAHARLSPDAGHDLWPRLIFSRDGAVAAVVAVCSVGATARSGSLLNRRVRDEVEKLDEVTTEHVKDR